MFTTTPPNLDRRQTASASIPTTSYQACTWLGHCLGATCASYDDCDNDWICANKVCSPCCETQDSLDTTAFPTPTREITNDTAGGSTTSSKGLSTGAAIGIGIAIAAVLIAMAGGIAFWIWRARRKRNAAIITPTDRSVELQSDAQDISTGDQKQIITSEPRAELPAQVKPTELSSNQLFELEGDAGDELNGHNETYQSTMMSSASVSPSHQRRFEEYTLSPDASTEGQISFSPVSETYLTSLHTRKS